ncbi:MAG: 50S ribosomal protein L17 [bacterium]|nr:50S ribosomal protein L17 [bacterium]
MRHLKKGRKFGREKKKREFLLRNLAYSFLHSGKITTTEAKAKELQPMIERIISQAKTQNLATTRRLYSLLPARIIPKLVKEIAPKYHKRHGGFTRITKIGPRKSDSAKLAILELT